MSLLRLESVVRERLGLDPAALGPSVLPRAVNVRMHARSAATTEAYREVLADDTREILALAGELVVSESWFFRGGWSLFQRLAQLIQTRAAARQGGPPVRVLSLPCSSGEEPYSLAIALLEANVPVEACRIDAVDLCAASIEKAVAGRYSEFAFREPEIDPRPKYFRPSGAMWTLAPQVRHAVHFRTGNAIDAYLLADEPAYDLLMCRNLFIYLTPEGRTQALTTLDRLLAPDGCLCITPAEADRLPPSRFAPDGPVERGLYRRLNGITAPGNRGPGTGSLDWGSGAIRLSTGRAQPGVVPVPSPVSSPRETLPGSASAMTVDRARTLANGGRLDEARSACEALIRTQSNLPDTYSLLGVILEAEGNTSDAAEAFRKALYLAPDHPEALTHMILLCTARGDVPRAEVLRNRLRRLGRGDSA